MSSLSVRHFLCLIFTAILKMFTYIWTFFQLPQKCLFEQKNNLPNFGEQPITLPQLSAH